MQGNNQYFCSNCNGKSDAQRSLSFSQMPSVLNVQLARYAYNSNTGNKTKLMNPVLINRTLNVRTRNKSSVKYVLCAVQNHLGKSAQSGHYIAEAMDWSTGIWFEYDDESVTLLKEGPSYSFNDGADLDKAKGSSDAYNLFYVKQSCLQESVMSQITVQSSRAEGSIIEKVCSERFESYENHKK